MHRATLPGSLLGLIWIASCTSPPAGSGGALALELRSRPPGQPEAPLTKSARWDPRKTAIIICDMWDDHWCRGAAQRVVELAGPMNEVVKKARGQGIFVIHAPSSVTAFYEGTPQRQRARNAPMVQAPVPLASAQRWGTTWCWPDPEREPALPIDDSDMGCDCPQKCTIREAWTRQIAILEIDEADAITDHGQETYNLMAQRGIENVILMGVHLNMCVLGRPFGIRQMVYLKKNTVFVRDLTDTMYNSRMQPHVDHFTGTDLVIAHIEQYWCPSILSTDITGAPPFLFKGSRHASGDRHMAAQQF